MAILPNAEKAVIPIEKLTQYCLNPVHPVGKHKARIFKKLFGYTTKDAPELQDAIRQEILVNEAMLKQQDQYGQRYEVTFEHENTVGQGNICTGWIVKMKENFPRLTTCYAKSTKK